MIPFNIKSPSFHQSQGRIIVVFIIILRTIVIIVIGKGRIRCFVQVRLVVVRFILCKWKGRLCFLLVERQTSVALRTVHCTGSILLRGSNEGYILYISRLYIYLSNDRVRCFSVITLDFGCEHVLLFDVITCLFI